MKLSEEKRESSDSLILIEEEASTDLGLVQHDHDRHQQNQNAANMVRAGGTNSSSSNDKRKTGDMVDLGDNDIINIPNTDSDDDRSRDNNSETNSNRVRKYTEVIQKIRHQCGMAVNNKYVQLTMIAFIIINALMMGIATFDFIKEDPTNKKAFDVTDNVFLWIFTIELAMQFTYHGFQLLRDGWLVFDLIIITISWVFSGVQIVRAFRIFRAFRLITRVKIMKELILALLAVMPRMAAIFLMLFLIFYIFGVMFTQLFSGTPVVTFDYFGSLQATFLTLFQMMTMDGWAGITRELMVEYPWAWAPVIAFVIISGFIVVNLIVAVICDAIGALDDDEKAKFHGYDESTEYDSQGEAIKVELRDQLDKLEDQMGDLTRIQARTFHTLQYLTQQLQMQKAAKKEELESEGPVTSSNTTSKQSTTSKEQDRTTSGGKKISPMPSATTKDDQLSSLKNFSNMRGGAGNSPSAGYTDNRVSYTDTWTEQGPQKVLRRESISNFAKAAKELKKMREASQSDDDSKNSINQLSSF